MYRSGQVSESCPFSGMMLRGRTLISTAPAGKEIQIILSWQCFCSVLQFFLFQLSPSLLCLDLYVCLQNNWANQGLTIFQSSQMESIHWVPPITVSTTLIFLQLSESWEGGLMKTVICACLLKHVCQYGNKIWPKGSSATCVTLGLLKAVSFIYPRSLSNEKSSFLLLLIT